MVRVVLWHMLMLVWLALLIRGGGSPHTYSLRPSDATSLSVATSYYYRRDPQQWVTRREALGQTRYILGEIDQHTLHFILRADWILSPTLSIELYAQPFVSSGEYSEFKEVLDPQAPRFEDRFRTYGGQITCIDNVCSVDLDSDGVANFTFARPDFNVTQLRSTLVGRWEFRPGSVIYLAWQHGRNGFRPEGHFGGLADMADLFGEPATHTVMLKLNYWLGL
jgi:hypothetical protein